MKGNYWMRVTVGIALIIIFVGFGIAQAESIQFYTDNPEGFQYFKLNHRKLYQDNNSLFWKIYRSAEKRAVSCVKPEDTTDFLELGPIFLGSSELEEAFAKSIEKYVLAKPKCFLDGAGRLGNKYLNVLVKSYLITPLITEYKAINEAFKPYKYVIEYKQLMELYNN